VIIFARAGRRFIQPRPVTLFGEPIDTTRYLGVALDKRPTWSPHIKQVSRRTAQRMGLLGPVLNRSKLSVWHGVLLYMQLIRHLMDYACPVWRYPCTHIRRLQVSQSKCLCLVTGAAWYLTNRQIHEDLDVPLFTDHVRTLNASFDSRLPEVGNPPSTATRQIPMLTEARPLRPTRKTRAAGTSRPVEAIAWWWPSWPNKSCWAQRSRVTFACHDWGFSVIFPQL
jgi:hypothetical protein